MSTVQKIKQVIYEFHDRIDVYHAWKMIYVEESDLTSEQKAELNEYLEDICMLRFDTHASPIINKHVFSTQKTN